MHSRVLIADDNRDLADNLGEIVAGAGYVPTVVYDGESAARLGRSERFAAAVLDITMPRRDGLRVCAEIHQLWPATRIVLITGYDPRPDQAAGAGAAATLSKPLDVARLLSILGAAGDGSREQP
ncbi:MAG: response regulator [Planctomycetota bacterium]